MIIVVKDALDGRSFPEAGDYVYNLMLPFADTDEEFVLDLQGVSDLPSLFFNMCLKRFVDDRGANRQSLRRARRKGSPPSLPAGGGYGINLR